MAVEGIYDVDDELDFGKHKGQKVDHVIVEHPDYIIWALDTIEGFDLSAKAYELLGTARKKR